MSTFERRDAPGKFSRGADFCEMRAPWWQHRAEQFAETDPELSKHFASLAEWARSMRPVYRRYAVLAAMRDLQDATTFEPEIEARALPPESGTPPDPS